MPEDNTRELGEIKTLLESQGKRLDAVCKAVIGNGNTKNSIVSRVAMLEQTNLTEERSTTRLIAVSGVVVAVAAVLVAIFR